MEQSWAPGWLFGPQPPTPLTHLAAAPTCRPEIKNRFSTELGLGFTNSMTVSSWPSWRKHSQRPAEQEPRRGPAVSPSPPTGGLRPRAPGRTWTHTGCRLMPSRRVHPTRPCPPGTSGTEAWRGWTWAQGPGTSSGGSPPKAAPTPPPSGSGGQPAVLLPTPHPLAEGTDPGGHGTGAALPAARVSIRPQCPNAFPSTAPRTALRSSPGLTAHTSPLATPRDPGHRPRMQPGASRQARSHHRASRSPVPGLKAGCGPGRAA